MYKACIPLYFLLHFSTFFIGSTANANTSIIGDGINFNNTLVMFDPYVSILDKDNYFRYRVYDMLPLVTKVATRFNKIVISLSEIDMKNGLRTSLSLSPLTIAMYNNLSGEKTKKLEVWLAYSSLIPDHKYEDGFIFHKEPRRIIERLKILAENTNQIHTNTITTILLPYKLIENHIDYLLANVNRSLLTVVQQWGLLVDTNTPYSLGNFTQDAHKLEPNLVIFMRTLTKDINDLLSHFKISENDDSKLVNKGVTSLGLFVTAGDTDTNGNVNISNLVSIWQKASQWSEERRIPVILSKAFDTPYADWIERKTSGWWRLVEDSTYKNSSQFVFEEKVEKSDENQLSLVSPQDLHCDKKHVEIIFSCYDGKRSEKQDRLLDDELGTFLEKVSLKFDKFVLLIHQDNSNGLRVLAYELESMLKLKGQVEVTLVLLPNVDVNKMLNGKGSTAVVLNKYRDVINVATSFIVPFTGNMTADIAIANNFKFLLSIYNVTDYQFGYAFNISTCGHFFRMTVEEREVVNTTLNGKDTNKVVFYFEEAEETVALGAKRMFMQRIVEMEQCRKIVLASVRGNSTKLAFMLLHYSTNSEFYQSKRAMVNFVEYWQRLSDWAVSANTTIILSNAIDGKRYFKRNNDFLPEIGWIRYQGKSIGKDSSTSNRNNVWVDKVGDLKFRFSDEPRPSKSTKSFGFEIYEIVLILLVISIVVLIVALYFLMSNRQSCLSNNELNGFFNGYRSSEENDTMNGPYNIPYDKSRFEVDRKSFEIESDKELGSGEFGLVCRGKLIQENGTTVDVAVKMVNPHKFRKTILNGLLSEIKVLAHVGKHENIVELLRANTSELKYGKVFIFLELCFLGSLEQYLRKTLRQSQEQVFMERKMETNSRYENILNSQTTLLDPCLLEDLHRWSREICNGMAFLASKHVVHADLATRNVLLNLEKRTKICDFGLSRRMHNYANYAKQGLQQPMPWKWMSPESLSLNQFSEKSDVWAYGVTLWEIYSLGDTPYQGLSWDPNFSQMLQLGFRLLEPKYNQGNMYSIMKDCWNTNPDKRPCFAVLLQNL